MDGTVGTIAAGAPAQAASRRSKPRFFQTSTALLLVAVLAGFAPTFFLRPLTGYGPMHWYLWLHGAVLTAWFVVSLVQTSLVAARRTDLHRRLGVWGAWLAGGVVAVGIYAIWVGPHDAITGTNGFIVPAARMDGGPFLNAIGGLSLFAIFAGTGIVLRRKVEIHRRLMFMASVAIIFPAAGRIPIVMLAALHLPNAMVAIVGGGIAAAYCIGLPLALLAYDLVTRRGRPHLATVSALAAYFPVFFGQFIFADAPLVQAAIRTLE